MRGCCKGRERGIKYDYLQLEVPEHPHSPFMMMIWCPGGLDCSDFGKLVLGISVL